LASDSKKESYARDNDLEKGISKVLRLGLVSAASAVAGGLAVAWWYRKTLTKLQNPIASSELHRPEFLETEEKPLPTESESSDYEGDS